MISTKLYPYFRVAWKSLYLIISVMILSALIAIIGNQSMIFAEPIHPSNQPLKDDQASSRLHQNKTKKKITKRKRKRKKTIRSRNKKISKKRRKKRRKRSSINQSEFKQRFQKTLNHKDLKGATVALHVESLDTGKIIFSHQADQLLHPASNTKLITSAVAYELLGAEYQYQTSWYVCSSSKSNFPSIYWVASGDPKILEEQLDKVAQSLQKQGITKVSHIAIDLGDFTDEELPPGYGDKPEDDAGYRAPVSAASAHFNQVTLTITPSEVGQPPTIQVLPNIRNIHWVNEAQTIAKGKEKIKVEAAHQNHQLRYFVNGTIPKDHKGVSTRRRVTNVHDFVGKALGATLASIGIEVMNDQVVLGPLPTGCTIGATIRSPSLSKLLADINFYSNNFMAELTLLSLGQVSKGFGGWTEGRIVVERYLQEHMGIKNFKYVNGSGLFGDTRFSARQFVTVLKYMNQKTKGLFAKLLPTPAGEGTLKRRMRLLKKGVLRAKTGTLNGVSSLSGYLTTRSGTRLVFSLLMNELSVKAWKARRLQDRLMIDLWKLAIQ